MHTINAGGEFCAFWVNCAKPESTRSVTCRALSSAGADIFRGAYVCPGWPDNFFLKINAALVCGAAGGTWRNLAF